MHPRAFAATALLFSLFVSGCDALVATPLDPKFTEDEIRASFDRWRAAMVAHDAIAAPDLVTDDSLEQMAALQQKALHASRQELDQLPLIERMLVLLLRLHANADELAAMSSREVFGFFVEMRAFGAEYKDYSRIEDVQAEGDAATGRHVKFDNSIGAPLRFVRENGGWHVDLVPVIRQMQHDFDSYAESMKGDAEALSEAIVEYFSRKKLEAKHFAPMANPEASGVAADGRS